MERSKMKIIANILALPFVYMSICTLIYRFKNPELTETQLFLKIPDAVMMRWEKQVETDKENLNKNDSQ